MSKITIENLESKISKLQSRLADEKKREQEKVKKESIRRAQIIGNATMKAVSDNVLDKQELLQILELFASENDKDFAMNF